MRKFIEDFVAVTALIATEAWFLKGYFAGAPEFEPAIAFIVALGAILGKEPVRAHFSATITTAGHDKELFSSFLNVLPPERTSRFYREQNFGDSFDRANVSPLFEFVETWNSVEKEFLDEPLEKKRRAFYTVAEKFTSEIVGRTVPLQDVRFASVYSEQQRAAGPRPKSVIEDAAILNKLATSFLTEYEDFVRACRAKLST